MQPRTGFLQSTPVIGRHSRPQPGEWPNTGRNILAAYPDSPEYTVRVLGGAEVAEHLLGYVPDNWEVTPFGGEDPHQFLRRIDFWVYMHHPDLKEAFGRAAMEALAAGCVAILPPYMQELFGDAALYANPHQVPELVDEYFADRQKFLQQSARAQEFARGFSPQMHIDRLRELGVQTPDDDGDDGTTAPQASDRFPLTRPAGAHPAPTVVIIDSAPDPARVEEYRAAAAQNPQLILVTADDQPWEGLPPDQAVFVPLAARLNMELTAWQQIFAHRVQRLVEGIGPERICYDGALPPAALTRVLQGLAAEKIWLRRYPQHAAQGEGASAAGLHQVQAEPHFHTITQAEETGSRHPAGRHAARCRMTDLISPTLPWHQSLEQWCAEHIGHSRQAVPTQAQFAPFEAHKPEKFHQVAVVLVVLTSATRHVHRGFAEAAELIRASTSGFRRRAGHRPVPAPGS